LRAELSGLRPTVLTNYQTIKIPAEQKYDFYNKFLRSKNRRFGNMISNKYKSKICKFPAEKLQNCKDLQIPAEQKSKISSEEALRVELSGLHPTRS